MNRSLHQSVGGGSIKSCSSTISSLRSKFDQIDWSMSDLLYDVVKSGSMIKRAQNKKRFTPVNYKQRWFELTKKALSYYDVQNVERRRERGRIPVRGVRLVEIATVNSEGGDPFAPDGYPFQVGYCETSDDESHQQKQLQQQQKASQTPQQQRSVPQYTLYLVADSEKERSDWIRAIRQVCEDTNTPKSYRFHPGLWSRKKWSCCKGNSRTTFGCQAATYWRETNNNPSTYSLSIGQFIN